MNYDNEQDYNECKSNEAYDELSQRNDSDFANYEKSIFNTSILTGTHKTTKEIIAKIERLEKVRNAPGIYPMVDYGVAGRIKALKWCIDMDYKYNQ